MFSFNDPLTPFILVLMIFTGCQVGGQKIENGQFMLLVYAEIQRFCLIILDGHVFDNFQNSKFVYQIFFKT